MISILLALSLTSPVELTGVWEKDCARGVTRREVMDDVTAELYETFHASGACGAPVFTLGSVGTVDFPEGREPERTLPIDFEFTRVILRPETPAVAEGWNRRGMCGLTGWLSGVGQDVAGAYCELFGEGLRMRLPEAGRRVWGVIRWSGDQLWFGKLSRERDGSSADRRPVELDGEFYRRVQLSLTQFSTSKPSLLP